MKITKLVIVSYLTLAIYLACSSCNPTPIPPRSIDCVTVRLRCVAPNRTTHLLATLIANPPVSSTVYIPVDALYDPTKPKLLEDMCRDDLEVSNDLQAAVIKWTVGIELDFHRCPQ